MNTDPMSTDRMTTNRRSKPLYRDPNDKMVAGVCSGLGQYLDIDTVLVRVGFVVVTLLGGGGLLAYVLLWAILDPAPASSSDAPDEPPRPQDRIAPAPSLDDRPDMPLDVPAAGEVATQEPRSDES